MIRDRRRFKMVLGGLFEAAWAYPNEQAKNIIALQNPKFNR